MSHGGYVLISLAMERFAVVNSARPFVIVTKEADVSDTFRGEGKS